MSCVTNIVIDESLTEEAFSLTGLKTKPELVEFSLKELILKGRKAKRNTIVMRLSNYTC
ncbi:MAG TPA: type II toxin-antitoxin system VapB family antitoxin [Leucothrix sp.]|nr:type II toxin-antitoxin system VapB family antitoxin [Leucothrix sp.]